MATCNTGCPHHVAIANAEVQNEPSHAHRRCWGKGVAASSQTASGERPTHNNALIDTEGVNVNGYRACHCLASIFVSGEPLSPNCSAVRV